MRTPFSRRPKLESLTTARWLSAGWPWAETGRQRGPFPLQHRDRLVALIGLRVGLEHPLVDREPLADEVAAGVDDLHPDRVTAPAADHAGRGDRAGIDDRVPHRAPVLLERADRIAH